MKMKLFQTICRQLRSSKFSVESAALVAFSTSSYSCGRKKKVNPYEEVDQEKYSNLVQSVLSSRGVAQTPGSVEEDALLCGPVSKHKLPNQDVFLQGKRFHEALESILSPQETLKERDENLLKSGYIESVQHILKDVSGVRALESAVQHETLNYIGLLDCVAEYQGKLCVIDWKTSEKPKPFIQSTFDNPLQVVAYMGAMNHDTNYSFQVQCGLIVVAYKDGSPAHPHFMDAELCSQYWTKWLLRLEEYTEKKKNQNIQKPEYSE
ncbi:mitochondrial genome maintenance exonuclease 1 [Homo sapiens]|uniref:Mitochondrial genome maintenance exonuclease 1 n=1 Tax=Homo sapiens TaxID=9606 RepID=Q5QPE8_HUMAN|nr:mitochondrial genome maintenance exonuclease 1 isoform 4 [Homo sapiens]XP_047296538.1 mitochondrial genome maintenance exonuclease 1 isoform X3 [Homo sapiens]XP_047296539.1 mitochondrial genome maintenance exonuclease 1 isoform X3 [Homo sapiens]XP_054180192.1 mitochondrial genome maintenance exonuclease 1 isoform X3 [Homo sapiens]XP_054180194.1 mitochondrial genome maintenance exonuclease 1 isoform X3 [Homo sapiens]KAI2594153.1 mitochondrial genome maintenance exonuclease 1 [Homo sapiens]K|eukprot:XP_011527697.1 mitochondrial genome maintenance exonuclease 1 isoform X3 [Homo sapiens]